jgi:hypothetical protein
VLAEAICADGCEELFWFFVIGGIVAFTIWIWTSAMAGGAAMLAVRRRRPDLGAWGLVAVMTGVTAATAIGTAAVATSLDVGPVLLAVPLGALAWFVVELRHATSARRADRSRSR